MLEDTFGKECNETLLNYKMPNELYNKYFDILEKEYIYDELIKKKRKGFLINNSIKQLKAMRRFLNNPLQFIKDNSCHVCDNNFSVDPYGNVRICFNMEPIGNIKEQLPEYLWTNEKSRRCREFAKNCNRPCRLLVCNFSNNRGFPF